MHLFSSGKEKTLLKMDGKIKLNNPLITKTNILARDHLKAFDLIIDKLTSFDPKKS